MLLRRLGQCPKLDREAARWFPSPYLQMRNCLTNFRKGFPSALHLTASSGRRQRQAVGSSWIWQWGTDLDQAEAVMRPTVLSGEHKKATSDDLGLPKAVFLNKLTQACFS